MDNSSNPNEREFRDRLLREDALRSALERQVIARQGELAKFEKMMQGDHEFNFPTAKNHLDHWEMDAVTRVNRWRADFDRLSAPSYAMYEARSLMRYVQNVQKNATDGD